MIRLAAEWQVQLDDGRWTWGQADWWEHFLDHVYRDRDDPSLDAELAKYGGTHYYEDPTGNEFVDFENEKLATLFLLRWT